MGTIATYEKASLGVEGGVVTITWEDCGDSSTHGKATDLEPTSFNIGDDFTMTGTGSSDIAVSDGSFNIHVEAAGIIKKDFAGSICEAKVFKLPLGLGKVTWGGMSCPVAAGTLSVPIGLQLSSSVPAALANGKVAASASTAAGEDLLCVNAQLHKQALANGEVCSLFEVSDESCGESDLDCDFVKYAKAAQKGLADGTCADQGYTVQTGTQTKHYPVIGDIVIATYEKASLGVEGGEVTITWEDCGDSSTHGKVTDLEPTSFNIGDDFTMTGTGSSDIAVSDGSFNIHVEAAGLIKKDFAGSICEAKVFKLPLGLGKVTWGGMSCPVAAGTLSVPIGLQLSSSVPAALANDKVAASASTAAGEDLLCVNAQLHKQAADLVV